VKSWVSAALPSGEPVASEVPRGSAAAAQGATVPQREAEASDAALRQAVAVWAGALRQAVRVGAAVPDAGVQRQEARDAAVERPSAAAWVFRRLPWPAR
jgi:hypothetical protein